MHELLLSVLVNVASGIILYYIIKKLDKNK